MNGTGRRGKPDQRGGKPGERDQRTELKENIDAPAREASKFEAE
jgi:hypothetical protein